MTKDQGLKLLVNALQQMRLSYQEHLLLQKALAVVSGQEKETNVSDKRSPGPDSKD
jgi:hypothetical protein